ncbi:hypothetical protein SAMD00019534_121480 [Acytostelium subglobosum LB1]|uniref:hypothetical protein n=1 Tax=Acytostelium subglobosum LB1 TaxID=1410327 RepID=UPI000644DA65|nr:hypothetical protein SAMD00019534_121480 [Acytostelium subglobosum LB1]GAM28972.1 hypothetical protein SAMD00019534_121480 [Acytostelium subglobosum LB1]|eukprot:XP_012748157.1 hypothetical protein SAMD00019534_121480 [Acytostelium subglobosum LB1]
MAKFKLGNWAAMIVLCTSYILVAVGIMATFYPRQFIGIYAIIIGVLLFPLTWGFKFLGPLRAIFQQYIVAAILCLVLSAPCFFEVPTVIGGACLVIASLIYAISAFIGEKGDYFDKSA